MEHGHYQYANRLEVVEYPWPCQIKSGQNLVVIVMVGNVRCCISQFAPMLAGVFPSHSQRVIAEAQCLVPLALSPWGGHREFHNGQGIEKMGLCLTSICLAPALPRSCSGGCWNRKAFDLGHACCLQDHGHHHPWETLEVAHPATWFMVVLSSINHHELPNILHNH